MRDSGREGNHRNKYSTSYLVGFHQLQLLHDCSVGIFHISVSDLQQHVGVLLKLNTRDGEVFLMSQYHIMSRCFVHGNTLHDVRNMDTSMESDYCSAWNKETCLHVI